MQSQSIENENISQSKSEKEIKIPEQKRGKYISLPTYEKVKKLWGIFRNLEYPGTGISFPFRIGWKGPVKQFTFFDGLEYEIPESLVDHLNNNCAYREMKWISADGTETVNAMPIISPSMPNFIKETGKVTHRFLFQITESKDKKDASINTSNDSREDQKSDS